MTNKRVIVTKLKMMLFQVIFAFLLLFLTTLNLYYLANHPEENSSHFEQKTENLSSGDSKCKQLFQGVPFFL